MPEITATESPLMHVNLIAALALIVKVKITSSGEVIRGSLETAEARILHVPLFKKIDSVAFFFKPQVFEVKLLKTRGNEFSEEI